MSIVKMKRIRLFGMRSDREEILRVLQRAGCVEIAEPSDLEGAAWQGLSRPDDRALNEAREASAAALAALDILKKYAPAKGGLLKARPVISEREFFDEEAYRAARKTARTLVEAEQRITGLNAERSKVRGQKMALAPWLGLDLPLETASTRETAIHLGTVPGKVVMEELLNALKGATDLAQLTEISADQNARYLFFACHKAVEEAAEQVLKEYGFSQASLKGWTGTARENDRRLDETLVELERELEAAKAGIAGQKEARKALERCADRAAQEVRREEAKSRLRDTETAFFLEGWAPAESLDALRQRLEPFGCAFQAEDPAEEDYPSVPVKLKNNALTRPLNMVTEMYSLPAYNGIDPNPLMAPFFILFYGIMMADMGYGLLMMLASVFVLKKVRPKGGMHNFFALLGLCGISTFFLGALTGGFFGDFIPQLLKVINPESQFVWFWKPLFTPLDNTLQILVGSMVLGFVQINAGMLISFVKKLKEGQYMDALWEEVTWWVVFLGIGLAILGVTPLLLALGGLLVVAGPVVTNKGAGKITGIFGSLYNHVTGYFGDILSYSRLMALMLAGSVIAQVFNTLGAIPGNVLIFVIISMAGNTLNFALNLLGCYVHDLRLQCLEYFGKFYQDGGRPFRPLEINTKFVDIQE